MCKPAPILTTDARPLRACLDRLTQALQTGQVPAALVARLECLTAAPAQLVHVEPVGSTVPGQTFTVMVLPSAELLAVTRETWVAAGLPPLTPRSDRDFILDQAPKGFADLYGPTGRQSPELPNATLRPGQP